MILLTGSRWHGSTVLTEQEWRALQTCPIDNTRRLYNVQYKPARRTNWTAVRNVLPSICSAGPTAIVTYGGAGTIERDKMSAEIEFGIGKP